MTGCRHLQVCLACALAWGTPKPGKSISASPCPSYCIVPQEPSEKEGMLGVLAHSVIIAHTHTASATNLEYRVIKCMGICFQVCFHLLMPNNKSIFMLHYWAWPLGPTKILPTWTVWILRVQEAARPLCLKQTWCPNFHLLNFPHLYL